MALQQVGGRTGTWLAAAGAVLAAVAIGLSAYAAHGVADAHARGNLQTASLYAFGHGIALAALAPSASRRLQSLALLGLLAGTLLFAGSLAGGALFGWPTGLAPFGGTVLMASWLLYAVGTARR